MLSAIGVLIPVDCLPALKTTDFLAKCVPVAGAEEALGVVVDLSAWTAKHTGLRSSTVSAAESSLKDFLDDPARRIDLWIGELASEWRVLASSLLVSTASSFAWLLIFRCLGMPLVLLTLVLILLVLAGGSGGSRGAGPRLCCPRGVLAPLVSAPAVVSLFL